MLNIKRLGIRSKVTLAAVIVASAALGTQGLLGGQAHGAGTGPWTPTSSQIDGLRSKLIQMATYDDPNMSGVAAAVAAQTASTWPSNVTSVNVIGLDRQSALNAMGTPGAIDSQDARQVLLVQLAGTFALRGISHPSISGVAAPATSTVRYLQVAIDPATGNVTDFGGVDTAMDMSGGQVIPLS